MAFSKYMIFVFYVKVKAGVAYYCLIVLKVHAIPGTKAANYSAKVFTRMK